VSSSPPESLAAGGIELTRVRTADAEAVAVAVRASLTHLSPWMGWATEQAADLANQRVGAAEAEEAWEKGSNFGYVIRRPGSDEVVGMLGIHHRVGPDGVDIGYWLHADYLGRGYATSAVRAATEVALRLDGVNRVEIHTDEANLASAAIPRRLGYRLDRVEPRAPQAPAETGQLQIWVTP
jgi:RimJ/RimL family protein N-acetyltransferase